ncbi:MAG TPA: CPBP family intramembrane glutamic endopeptidase, partial [Hymenobacter sp.]
METPVTTANFKVEPLDQPVAAYPTIKQSWGMMGWYLLLMLGVGVPVYLVLMVVVHLPKSVAASVLVPVVELLMLFLLLWKVGALRRSQLTLTGQEIPWLYAALPVLVLAQITLMISLLELLQLPNWAEGAMREQMKQPVLGFLVACVVAPVLEELIFRGLILNGLLRNYTPWVAIGQSALLFGLFHMSPAQTVGAGL